MSKGPFLLSALVCPGAGQCLQRRWGVGIFFIVAFLIPLVMLIAGLIMNISANLRIVMDPDAFQSEEALSPHSLARIFAWLGIALLVYGVNIIDVLRTERKQQVDGKTESP